ncbi:DUF1661 domain-containing protein [Porphyromonas gulae]|uniref:DUF1661 domain-containing protein n=1 Tax=Porphyromonas gulae TaxID=111105 RepID=UPI001F183C9D|nr:DUF1661 domain-containing protein [Porphyromonas gulae]
MKIFGAKTKNFSRVFSGKHAPRSEHFGPYRRDSSMLSHWLAAPIAIVSMATCRPYALSDEHASLHRSNSR